MEKKLVIRWCDQFNLVFEKGIKDPVALRDLLIDWVLIMRYLDASMCLPLLFVSDSLY